MDRKFAGKGDPVPPEADEFRPRSHTPVSTARGIPVPRHDPGTVGTVTVRCVGVPHLDPRVLGPVLVLVVDQLDPVVEVRMLAVNARVHHCHRDPRPIEAGEVRLGVELELDTITVPHLGGPGSKGIDDPDSLMQGVPERVVMLDPEHGGQFGKAMDDPGCGPAKDRGDGGHPIDYGTAETFHLQKVAGCGFPPELHDDLEDIPGAG